MKQNRKWAISQDRNAISKQKEEEFLTNAVQGMVEIFTKYYYLSHRSPTPVELFCGKDVSETGGTCVYKRKTSQ
jgi:hypothetical protein